MILCISFWTNCLLLQLCYSSFSTLFSYMVPPLVLLRVLLLVLILVKSHILFLSSAASRVDALVRAQCLPWEAILSQLASLLAYYLAPVWSCPLCRPGSIGLCHFLTTPYKPQASHCGTERFALDLLSFVCLFVLTSPSQWYLGTASSPGSGRGTFSWWAGPLRTYLRRGYVTLHCVIPYKSSPQPYLWERPAPSPTHKEEPIYSDRAGATPKTTCFNRLTGTTLTQ